MLDAAGLTPEERKQAVALFYSRVETLPGTEVTAPANIPEIQPGVIFCLRNELPKTIIDSTYALAPHYLVYVLENGEVCHNFPQAKKILDLLKKLALGKTEPDAAAVSAFNAITKHGADMERYQSLLAKAIAAVTGKADEKGIESQFQPGGTTMGKDTFNGADDSEVIAYRMKLVPQGCLWRTSMDTNIMDEKTLTRLYMRLPCPYRVASHFPHHIFRWFCRLISAILQHL